MAEDALTAHIERRLEAVGLNVVAEQSGTVITLSGQVDSDEARMAALDLAAELAPDCSIDDNLEVDMFLPQQVGTLTSAAPSPSAAPDTVAQTAEISSDIEPDFTDQSFMSDPIAASGATSAFEDPAADGDSVYVPPTDPVVTTDQHGRAQVLGGFEATAMDEITVPRSALDGRLGDEAIADAIRQELREDAATTDLQIRVSVRDGVVHLHGRVPNLEDAENAEEVAARVPGVKEVIEGLEVTALP